MATSSIVDPISISAAGTKVLTRMLSEDTDHSPRAPKAKTPEMTREEIEIMLDLANGDR